MSERSWVQTPTVETVFQAPFNWIKAWNKNCGTLKPGIDACAVNPQTGGWTLRKGWLMKSSYMVYNELEACQPTETKVQQKKYWYRAVNSLKIHN